MAQSITFDCLKISRTEVGINLEVNWLCLCDLAHFFMTKAKQDKMKCLLKFYSISLNLNHREIWSPKWRAGERKGENVSRSGDRISRNADYKRFCLFSSLSSSR